jgi:hypothetical protein
MMALTEQDRDWVQLTARELTFEVTKEVLAEHIKTCPLSQKQINYKHLIIGIVIGVTIVTGSGGLTLLLKFLGVPV